MSQIYTIYRKLKEDFILHKKKTNLDGNIDSPVSNCFRRSNNMYSYIFRAQRKFIVLTMAS